MTLKIIIMISIYRIFQIKIEIPEKTNQIEIKSTAIFTNIDTSQLYISFEKIESLLKELKDESYNKFLRKIENHKNNKELKEIKYEMKLLKKKRKINDTKYDINNNDLKNNISKKIRGRKKAVDHTKRSHNKNSVDNIIKKIKGYFIEFLIIFVN